MLHGIQIQALAGNLRCLVVLVENFFKAFGVTSGSGDSRLLVGFCFCLQFGGNALGFRNHGV